MSTVTTGIVGEPMVRTLDQEPFFNAMTRARSDILLEAFQFFGNRLVRLLLEARNLSTKDVSFAHREELLEEVIGVGILGGDSFMVGIKPLLHTR